MTGGGLMLPRLLNREVKATEAGSFSRAYATYRQEKEFSGRDGVEKQAANLRELVASYIQCMVGTRYCGREYMNERTLLAAGRAFVRIKDELDNTKFAVDMPELLGMNHRLRFEDRFAKVQSNLFDCMEEQDLYEEVIRREGWNSGVGGVVVKALLRGFCPPPCTRRV